METALPVAVILGPVALVLGLSVLLYAKAWQKLIGLWEKDHLGLFSLMLAYLVLGIVIVRTHNVWAWDVWVLVTITGWLMILKSVVYFLLPGALTKYALKAYQSMGMLYFCGLVCAVIGAVLSYYAYTPVFVTPTI